MERKYTLMTTTRCLLAPILPILSGAWLTLVISATPLTAAPGDEHWDTQFGWPGVTNIVFGLRHHEGRLYTGGLFAPPGGATNNQVDIWDGSQWTALPGLSGGLI
ncbi:MAG: hypothetical protein ACKV2U_04875, partial [Bryobacteraceae bacterium]